MTIVLIDNYDSFTYNLFHALAKVSGADPVVISNDDPDGRRVLEGGDVAAIVVSPGPGHPGEERDFGLSRWAVTQDRIPTLGICLGHQGMCLVAGARVDLAPAPVHGRTSAVRHDGDPLFTDIPSPFEAMRYHSLLVYDLPEEIDVVAATGDLVMAVRHRTKPQWGVQFHPESIATEFGERLLANFVRRCAGLPLAGPPSEATADDGAERTGSVPPYELRVRVVTGHTDAEAAYARLFGDEEYAFWLDSARVIPGLSRWSMMGAASGPLGEHITYDVLTDTTEIEYLGSGRTLRRHGDVLDYIGREQAARRVSSDVVPVDFSCGFVGYLGYELKTYEGASPHYRASTPDAQFVFADRAFVLDHETGTGYLLELVRTGEPTDDREGWLDRAAAAVSDLPSLPGIAASPTRPAPLRVSPRHSDGEYLDLIDRCQHEITQGDSYEICLTNMFSVDCEVDPWTTYRRLRGVNPAPFASLLRFGDDLSVLSSSPERFMRIGVDRVAESKPIKGTCSRGATPDEDRARAEDLAASEKERAENVMIVDLVRNDIGRTSEVGTVTVPVLCGIESYATVHQLVSTVRGTLARDRSPADCVRNAFPGGSMTGAPKLRTMEIIDALEAGPRGVYSGAIGYFSLDGAVDLSITIRTIVIDHDEVSVGVGGAITALSDRSAELAEIWLKATPLLETLAAEASSQTAPAVDDIVRPARDPVPA